MQQILQLLKNRINRFYLLAFIPLIVMAYFSVVRTVIPIYGYILLLIKKDKLLSFTEPNSKQQTLGIIVIILSLIAYYPVALVFPALADPYGIPNYILHLIGLFLIFFDFHALKEAFTPAFLIVAATSSFFVSESLKPPLSPYLTPFFMRIVDSTLRLLNLPVTTNYETRIMMLHTWKGTIPTIFDWGCIGVYSTLLFSIILVIILTESRSAAKAKLIWGAAGTVGTIIINVIRVLIIFLADYAYGEEVGAQVHYFIGYVLFMTWLTLFFILASKPLFGKQQELAIRQSSSRV